MHRRRRLEDDFAVGDEEDGDAGHGAQEAAERGVLAISKAASSFNGVLQCS
jgi:hypothetical protein